MKCGVEFRLLFLIKKYKLIWNQLESDKLQIVSYPIWNVYKISAKYY